MPMALLPPASSPMGWHPRRGGGGGGPPWAVWDRGADGTRPADHAPRQPAAVTLDLLMATVRGQDLAPLVLPVATQAPAEVSAYSDGSVWNPEPPHIALGGLAVFTHSREAGLLNKVERDLLVPRGVAGRHFF